MNTELYFKEKNKNMKQIPKNFSYKLNNNIKI